MLTSTLRSFALLALALLPSFVSCASTKGHERADNLATSMEQLETALAKAKTDLAATRTALSAVDEKANVDPKPSYDQLVASVKALNTSTARVSDTAAKIKERGNAYLANWERRSDAISDADIKAADAKRREKLASALKEVVESVAARRQGSRPARGVARRPAHRARQRPDAGGHPTRWKVRWGAPPRPLAARSTPWTTRARRSPTSRCSSRPPSRPRSPRPSLRRRSDVG
jgi:hypothetical protein